MRRNDTPAARLTYVRSVGSSAASFCGVAPSDSANMMLKRDRSDAPCAAGLDMKIQTHRDGLADGAKRRSGEKSTADAPFELLSRALILSGAEIVVHGASQESGP